VSWTLEIAIAAAVTGSVVALASVRPEIYIPLWLLCFATGGLLFVRARAISRLREKIGRRHFSFHPSDRWIVLDAESTYGLRSWTFDLDRTRLPRPPLLVPGLAFGVLVLLQLVPWPPGFVPWTLSPPDTLRGFGFLSSALVLHVAAAAVFESPEARERFRTVIAVLGVALAFVAVAQVALGVTRLYGFIAPLESGGTLFGPFVNRNHFAGYMLLVAPICLRVAARAFERYARRAGERINLRRRLVAIGSPDGVRLLYAVVPPLATIAALVATTSRGALVAFAVGLGVAALGLRRRKGVPAWALALGFVAMALSWYGLERLESRFRLLSDDAPGRSLVWKDALGRMTGRWLVGSGYNTFAWAMSRALPWRLPEGATAWPAPLASGPDGAWPGVRVPEGLDTATWYREAHNDYLQLLVETGLPGLGLALAAAVAVLRSARRDPWLVAALAALLLHEAVDFDLQIPAIAILFVTLAAMGRAKRR
jgi:O-antigen ligase